MISNSSRSMDENKCSEKFSEGARSFQFHDPTNLDNEEGFSEALSEEFFACATPLPQSSFLSCFVSENSTTVSDSATEDIGIQTTGIFDVPFISSIHRYLSEKDMPWNAQFLMHQLGAHDTMLARQRQMLSEITDNLGLSQDDVSQPLDHYEPQCSLPETSYIGTRFPSETSSGVVDETEDRTSESLMLEELFDLTEELVNCQTIHGEFDAQTLELEFKLGKSCHRNGNLDEAEYHCRRILRKHAQIDVQSFLGMVLSDASRTNEAMYLLFCALTGFISESAESSMRTNSLRFHPIQLLYLEVIPRSWASMNRVMFELMTTMEEAGSESTVDQFCQVLYIHGYSIAHECFLLGMVSSAKYMYQNILHPGRNLNSWLHGIEEAKARQIFGLVLKDGKEWEESVNQVLLACESALNSGVHDNQFIELLQSDFMELMPLLPPTAFELTTGDPLQAKLKILVDILQNKCPALQYAAPNLSQHAGIGESLPEIPQNLATTQSLRPSICNAPFESTELPLRELNQGRGSASRASTSGFSTAPSYKIGVSYTDSSGCTGVSISGFLGL
ncbi:hypothetical protein B0J14DRAFT_313599 [Halenospora varia]|nr:hypothetical protein B0J14DRAFT_313599 [Halenospora varia]